MSVGGAAKNSHSFLLQGQEGKTDQHDGYVDGQHQERTQEGRIFTGKLEGEKD